MPPGGPFAIALAMLVSVAGASPALTQPYPTRPITVIVPFPAGGSIDTVARVLGERMKISLGQPVVVENVTGAGGSIGVGRVAHAMPDGYTIGVGNLSTHVINGATYSLDYDVLRDFEPVSLLTTEPMMLGARKTMPAADLKELIAWLRANPDKATAAVGGTGDITQLTDMRFQRATSTRFQLVPYRGTVLALNDVIGERVDLVFMQASSLLPYIGAGTIKGYAVMGPKRLAAAPAIPTIAEAGLPDFDVDYWFGMWAPKGTSKTIVKAINTAIVGALADESVRARLSMLGREIVARDQQAPDALGALQRSEIKRWWPIIKAAGIKAE